MTSLLRIDFKFKSEGFWDKPLTKLHGESMEASDERMASPIDDGGIRSIISAVHDNNASKASKQDLGCLCTDYDI